MRRFLVVALLCCWVFVGKSTADDRIALRVLYCGDPGTQREADFKAFLQQHFTSVTVIDGTAFKEEQTEKADVVIFDWTATNKGDSGVDVEKLNRLRKTSPELSAKYSKPTIMIGARGGWIGNQLKLKLNWLCLCLDGPAHHIAVDHPLFHSPLEVKPEFEEIPTPEDYADITIDKLLGPTMKVWRVQTKDYPEIDSGLVSDFYGFADSPDSEVFAQGIAMKGPDTLSLGRQANFFMWGFSASPADMTDSGKRLFVNVVAYMKKFDGQKPLVRKASSQAMSREWALRSALWPRRLMPKAMAKTEKEYRESIEKELKTNPEMFPEEALDNPGKYIEKAIDHVREAYQLEMDLHPEALRKQFGMDADKYWAYYTENLEYLQPHQNEGSDLTGFVVDEDAKSLGTSNRKITSLDKWISMLEANDRPELATRLLKHYTQEDFDTAPKWRAWLNKNREQLFFSDVGGFKFFIAPAK